MFIYIYIYVCVCRERERERLFYGFKIFVAPSYFQVEIIFKITYVGVYCLYSCLGSIILLKIERHKRNFENTISWTIFAKLYIF